MGVKLNRYVQQEVEAKYVTVHAKVCDMGSYELLDADENVLGERNEDYVPNKVIPGSYGDYIELKIDIETGRIVNWVVPTAEDIRKAFNLDDTADE